MEKFTKTEVAWLIDMLEKTAAEIDNQLKSAEAECPKIAKEVWRLRYEQYTNMAARLKKALAGGDKIIGIQ